jgi:glycosyltransferase involved in cell wall biosynthesis
MMKTTACIVCFNNGGTLAAAIESVRAQSHPADELLVIDDASTDGSREVAARHGAAVRALPRNSGRGAARAFAMEQAAHGLVLMCDGPGTLDPGLLAGALPYFDDANVAAVVPRVAQPPPDGVVGRWRGRHLLKCEAPRTTSRRALLATHGAVLRRDAAASVGGFNASLRAGEDADLGRRLLEAGRDVVFDPALVAVTLKHDTLLSVLERYARWNTPRRMSWREYARQAWFSMRVMAGADLRAGDPLAACISLLSPHWQFWRHRLEKS